jgi:phosphoribosylformylglycinamidine synthase
MEPGMPVLIEFGDGLACRFKIESHNPPSAIERTKERLLGVGGINRDSHGALVCSWNLLRFQT